MNIQFRRWALLCLFFTLLGQQLQAGGDAAFSYAQIGFCVNSGTHLPVANNPGTWSASPATLAIDPVTGAVDTDISPLGGYHITHIVSFPSADTATVPFAILAPDSVDFFFPANPACTNQGFPVPTPIGVTGGTYTSSSSGLVMDSTMGQITLAASSVGIHEICFTSYAPPGQGCPATVCKNLTILGPFAAFFSYPSNQVCQLEQSFALDSQTIAGMGTFTAFPSGLALDSLTGEIQPALSTADTFQIRKVIGGFCPDTVTTVLIVHPPDTNISIAYPQDTFCLGDSITSPVITSTSPGIFLSSPGLTFVDSVGTISLQNSATGMHIIQYVSNDACNTVATDTIFIFPDPTFFLNIVIWPTAVDSLYAQTDAVNPTFQWYSGPAGQTLIPGATNQSVYFNAPEIYRVVVYESGNGCPLEATYPIFTNLLDAEEFPVDIEIFPNPSDGLFSLQLEMEKPGKVSWKVRDLYGRTLDAKAPVRSGTSYSQELDLSALPAGTFFLEIKVDGRSWTRRVVLYE